MMTTDVGPGQQADRIVYRWPRTRLVRPLGRLVLVLGGGWLLVTVLVAAFDLSGSAWFATMAVLSLLALAVAGAVLARPPAVLELTSTGYRLHNLRGGGTRSAAWSDVSTVSTGESVAGPVMVIEGRQEPSVVPLILLGSQAAEAQDRVRASLQAQQRRP